MVIKNKLKTLPLHVKYDSPYISDLLHNGRGTIAFVRGIMLSSQPTYS